MAKNEAGQEVNDQHINTNGRARLLSVGKYLPKEWDWVRVTKTKDGPNTILLEIRKLLIVVPNDVITKATQTKKKRTCDR